MDGIQSRTLSSLSREFPMTTIFLKPNASDNTEETPEWKAKLEEAMARLAALN